MDPITIALIAIGFNFISSMVSKSAANKLEEYKKAAQKNAQEQMLEMSRRLYCERLESERELHRFLLEQQRKGNAENLSIIAEQTEAYTKWPLNVSPIALRGSSSLLPDEMIETDGRQPCFLLVAPGADKELNGSLNELQELVFEFTSNYLTAARGHNVILLKDCWANSLKECDEIEARNIHSFIKDVPMIVVSPSGSAQGEVSFGLSMWNIFDRNCGHALSYSFGETVKFKNVNNLKSLADDLCAYLTYISDCYGWVHYREVPQLLTLVSAGALNLNEEVIGAYYGAYVKLLRDMTDNGLLSKLDESEAILDYCRAVDGPLHAQQAFAASGFIDDSTNPAILLLPQDVQAMVWEYVCDSSEVSGLLPQASLRELQCECLRRNWLEAFGRRTPFSSKICYSDMFNNYVDRYRRQIVSLGADIKKQGIEKMRAITDFVDLRDTLRPLLKKEGTERFKNEIYPLMIDDLIPSIVKSHKKYTNELVFESAKDLNRFMLDVDDFSDVGLKMAADIHSEFVESIQKTNLKEIVKKESLYLRVDFWASKVAQDWIEYVFLHHDVVHSDVGTSVAKKEDKLYFDDLKSTVSNNLRSIAKSLLNLDDDSPTFSSSQRQII